MLRHRQISQQLKVAKSLRLAQRLYSTVKTEVSVKEKLLKLKESKDLPPSAYSELLGHNDIVTGKEIEVVEEIIDLAKSDSNVSGDQRVQLHNFVLKNLTKYDYSLSTIHQREIKELKGNVDLGSLVEIIRYNPGRVQSSWELFETALKTLEINDPSECQELLATVLEKLIYGDSSEQEDGYKMNETALVQSVYLIKNLENPPKQLVNEVLRQSLETESYDLIDIIGLESLEQIRALEPNTPQFVKLWSIWNPATVLKEEIANNPDVFSKLVLRVTESDVPVSNRQQLSEKIGDLNSKFPNLKITVRENQENEGVPVFQKLMNILGESGVLRNPDSKYTPLRISVLKAFGMKKGDHKEALSLYHDFIAFDKQNVDKLMSTMVSIFSHAAVKGNDKKQLTIAEALIPQPIPYQALQSLILGYSAFDLEKSLEIFNDYIQKVSKTVDEDGISIAGLLTESLILAFLSKRDREFAYLIHDGAITNNIVTSETGKNRLKAIFKRYGEIVGEEGDQKINDLLKEEVLNAISKL